MNRFAYMSEPTPEDRYKNVMGNAFEAYQKIETFAGNHEAHKQVKAVEDDVRRLSGGKLTPEEQRSLNKKLEQIVNDGERADRQRRRDLNDLW